MYIPVFRKKKTGLPVLSKNDIDIIGEKLVADFCPDALKTPMEIDIDAFAQSYLGLKQDFQYLSHNGVYLGMMVFNDTNKVPVYNPSTKRAEYISAQARTIIIDNGLLEDKQERRYRFTVGHESAHAVFHSGYYGYDPNQMTLFNEENIPLVQCRVDNASLSKKHYAYWTDNDWIEWQANRLSSAVLMPASMVREVVARDYKDLSAYRAACWVMELMYVFNVSAEAAEIRLRDLGFTNNYSKLAILIELSEFAPSLR